MMSRYQILSCLAALVLRCSADTSSSAPYPAPSAPYPAPAYVPVQEGPYPPAVVDTTSHGLEPAPYYGAPQEKVGTYSGGSQDVNLYSNEGYQQAYGGYENGYALQPGYEYLTPGAGISGFAPFGALGYPVGPTWGSPFSSFWDLVPYPRTIVSFAGKTVSWIIGGVAIILVGVVITAGLCTFTPLCTISFNGMDHLGLGNLHTIHEEVRSFMTPEKLNAATEFVKGAIDKYQRLQRSINQKQENQKFTQSTNTRR